MFNIEEFNQLPEVIEYYSAIDLYENENTEIDIKIIRNAYIARDKYLLQNTQSSCSDILWNRYKAIKKQTIYYQYFYNSLKKAIKEENIDKFYSNLSYVELFIIGW
jgi:hypothetical protein